MMCMVHNPVGVSGNTGRVDFEESCEVVDYQLKSALKCVANRTKTPVCQCQNCSKRTFQGQHHVSDHTKGYAGDSGGSVVTCEDICTWAFYTHTCTPYRISSQIFTTVRYFCSCSNFCISGKRKVTGNLDEVVRRSYISSHVQFQH